jgi:putative transposase|tara:strand:- start:1133 stop:1372 length:240 start_codon:yes stop_codon:yes gene_type:complete
VFVEEGKSQTLPWAKLRNQVYLGSSPFAEKIQSLIDGDKELNEIPPSSRCPPPRTLVDYKLSTACQNAAIFQSLTDRWL